MSEVRVPELAESITEGRIVRWVRAVGDRVRRGDPLIELETDKVNMEVVADQDGVLAAILRGPGETVRVGETIATLGAGAAPGGEPPGRAAGGEAPGPVAGVEPPGPGAGPAVTPATGPGVGPAVAPATGPGAGPAVAPATGAGTGGAPVATPAARRWARAHGVDLAAVPSRDPFGRLGAGDLQAGAVAPAPAAPAPVAPTAPSPDQAVERIPMTRRRQTIAERLVQAQHNAAMLTTFNEVDMTAVMAVRKRRQEQFLKQHQVKLGFLSFFVKAVIGALKVYPLLNAEIQGTDILIKKFYDIGIAVSTPEGLVVPVVRGADRLSFGALEAEIARLADAARRNQLKLSDLQGGTFTITNGGVFGSMLSTPILNPPQVGILGMHKIQLRPVALDETRMENRPIMYVAVSYDHRIVDGREAVSFLVKVKELLEDPEALLLEG